LTGEDLGTALSSEIEKIRVNNRLRRAVRSAMGQLTLMSPDAAVRIAAARSVLRTADPESLELLNEALGEETDPQVKQAMEVARAAIVLKTDADAAKK